MSEITELNPGDIQRGDGVSVGGSQQSQGSIAEAAPAEMGVEQQAALKEVDRLRVEYGKTPADQRDALAKKMSELQRFVFGHGGKPADFMPGQPSPPDMRPHDPMAGALADAGKTLTPQEREHLVTHGKVMGLTPEAATRAADFCLTAGLDRVTAKTVTERIAKHAAAGWDGALSEAEHAELTSECARRFGSVERADAEIALAHAYLSHKGLTGWWDKNPSLFYDPPTILALAYRARVNGLQAAK